MSDLKYRDELIATAVITSLQSIPFLLKTKVKTFRMRLHLAEKVFSPLMNPLELLEADSRKSMLKTLSKIDNNTDNY